MVSGSVAMSPLCAAQTQSDPWVSEAMAEDGRLSWCCYFAVAAATSSGLAGHRLVECRPGSSCHSRIAFDNFRTQARFHHTSSSAFDLTSAVR